MVDEYFADEKPFPYSLNINVILPNTTHLRTGLYRPNKPQVHQIKIEPGVDEPCSIQTLPEFTSVFSVPQTVNSLFIKPDIDVTDELHIGPQQPAVYQMPVSSSDLTQWPSPRVNRWMESVHPAGPCSTWTQWPWRRNLVNLSCRSTLHPSHTVCLRPPPTPSPAVPRTRQSSLPLFTLPRHTRLELEWRMDRWPLTPF